MAEVHIPRSLSALFPSLPRRVSVEARDMAGVIRELDERCPGVWDRLCEPGPRLRRHINAFVDGQLASLASEVGEGSVVHIIPAVSGGARRSVLDDGEQVHFETASEWSDWLERNHARREGVWLVQWKARTRKPAIPYEEAISEALRFGWIDATYRSLDDERGMLWWSPRRKGSVWARTNKERIARLEAAGRMTPAGQAVVEAAKADGSWTILEPVEDLVVPDDLAAALDARPGARDRWESMAPTNKRAYLLWIVTAKQAPTRAKRVTEATGLIAQGKRLDQR